MNSFLLNSQKASPLDFVLLDMDLKSSTQLGICSKQCKEAVINFFQRAASKWFGFNVFLQGQSPMPVNPHQHLAPAQMRSYEDRLRIAINEQPSSNPLEPYQKYYREAVRSYIQGKQKPQTIIEKNEAVVNKFNGRFPKHNGILIRMLGFLFGAVGIGVCAFSQVQFVWVLMSVMGALVSVFSAFGLNALYSRFLDQQLTKKTDCYFQDSLTKFTIRRIDDTDYLLMTPLNGKIICIRERKSTSNARDS